MNEAQNPSNSEYDLQLENDKWGMLFSMEEHLSSDWRTSGYS
jgi:hypothetical protein